MPDTILAIDPGSARSAWLTLRADGRPFQHGIFPNEALLDELRDYASRHPYSGVDQVVIEWTAPRGMPASAELFETMWWAGRFAEAAHPLPVDRLQRLRIKRHLCGTTAAKDANVRAALIDRFGGAGGKATAVGVKRQPGPLYGISKDVWAALAVAVTWADGQR